MKYVIIGNNDGPLVICNALVREGLPLPLVIGLQNGVKEEFNAPYSNFEIPIVENFNEKEIDTYLERFDIDVIINIFCNFKYTTLLEKYRCFNIHLGPLPAYKGRHPLHHALLSGEKMHGYAIHRMNEAFDDGEIYYREKVLIPKYCSVLELRQILMQRISSGFPKFFASLISGTLKNVNTDNERHTYFRPIQPSDSEVSIDDGLELTIRRIHTFRGSEFPAFYIFENRKIYLEKIISIDDKIYENDVYVNQDYCFLSFKKLGKSLKIELK